MLRKDEHRKARSADAQAAHAYRNAAVGGNMGHGTQLHPAPLRRRFKAFLLDSLVIAAYLCVLLGVGVIVKFALLPTHAGRLSPLAMDLVAFLLTILPAILYFAIQEGGQYHATKGKRRAGIEVAAADGGSPGLDRALVRSALKFAPWQLAHTSLFHIPGWPFAPAAPGGWVMLGLFTAQGLVVIYVLLILITKSHRTLYDRASGTMVIVSS